MIQLARYEKHIKPAQDLQPGDVVRGRRTPAAPAALAPAALAAAAQQEGTCSREGPTEPTTAPATIPTGPAWTGTGSGPNQDTDL